ncbi:MAG: phenylalanine--tRNA ligase subunit beta [Candidatus Hermodarchaeota archaeon]
MVAIEFSFQDILKLLGKPLTIDELDNLVSNAVAEVEDYDGDDIKVDIKTSNRPDLWSIEGLVREVKPLLLRPKAGLPKLQTESSGLVVEVSPELASVRPYIACVVVQGLEFDDYLIKQLIQTQEKLDFSWGRNRRRTSIGVYNLSMIQSPVRYILSDPSFRFVPLGFTEKMTLSEILEKHPKGQEYAHILADTQKKPLLLDKNDIVLSLPPIINSNDVGRITEETQEVLIEVTGTDIEAVHVVVNILAQNLYERGGKIFTVENRYPPEINNGETVITPITTPESILIDPKLVSQWLGVDLSLEKIIDVLLDRNYDVKKNKNLIVAFYPSYRKDILHWVDVAEDIAIGLGYMNIEPQELTALTVGTVTEETKALNQIRNLFVGLGYLELMTNTLTDPSLFVEKTNSTTTDELVHIENPISQSQSIIRNNILPGLLEVLAVNTHATYPQNIFEIGEVVELQEGNPVEMYNLCAVSAGAEKDYSNMHTTLNTFMRLTGLNFSFQPTERPYLLPGRGAEIIYEGKKIGFLGELHPEILEEWEIWLPVAVMEIKLSEILTNIPKILTY